MIIRYSLSICDTITSHHKSTTTGSAQRNNYSAPLPVHSDLLGADIMHNPQIMANLPYIFESTGYYSSPSTYYPTEFPTEWTSVQIRSWSATSVSFPSAPYVDGGYTSAVASYSNYSYAGCQDISGLQRTKAAHGNVGTEGLVGRARAAKHRSRGYGKEKSGSRGFYTQFG